MILVVAGLKGGVGKSTLAALLALAAARAGRRVLLVDADPQGSILAWANDAEGLGDNVTVIGMTSRLDRDLRRLAAGHDDVVIDTAPGRGDLGTVNAAARTADLVLVPMSPSVVELDRLRPTLAVAEAAGTPAVVVLNRTRARTRSTRELIEAVEQVDDLAVLDTVIPFAERFATAFGRRTAPDPIPALWAELVALWEALSAR